MTKKLNTNLFSALFLGWQLSFLTIIPLVGFVLLGVFLDNRFDSSPIFVLSGAILGLLISIFEIYYFIKSSLTETPENKIKRNPDV